VIRGRNKLDQKQKHPLVKAQVQEKKQEMNENKHEDK
jgi:hypothetical protein